MRSSRVATLFLIVGLPGSGKTTLAKELERDRRGLRLTPDERIAALALDAYDEAARSRVEALQWAVAARTLELGIDVILDFGFWSRAERDDYRGRAAALGAATELRFLDVPRPELEARLAARNVALPSGTFFVDPAKLDAYAAWLEPPSADELERRS